MIQADPTAALQRALSLSVDSAIAASDALSRADAIGLASAIEALVANGKHANELFLAWGAFHD